MKKALFICFKILIVLLLISLIIAYNLINASLPKLDGDIIGSTTKQATVLRDVNGTPTIFADNRSDLSFVLGYLHSQERFFQMDLLRRNAAGELSELFGHAALDHDKKMRLHQFRKRASGFIQNLPPEHKTVLDKYTQGINQGLADLNSKPFEYWLLNKAPAKWQAVDSLLVMYSMYMDLQYADADRERTLAELKDNLMPDVYQFLNPAGSKWDAALDGSEYPPSAIPINNFNLSPVIQLLQYSPKLQYNNGTGFYLANHQHEALAGSNNWAVSGTLTQTGSAMLADDMHLTIGVPNIWYRASFRFHLNNQQHQVDGVTLPGTPAMVVGSNGLIAWGFTNSYGDWNDVIKLKLDETGERYLTASGLVPFEVETETIMVSGGKPVQLSVKQTIWGPVIGHDHNGQAIALRWVAHDPEGINLNLLNMETATDVTQAITVAHLAGIPAQNIMLADSQGNIAWTIAGAIPNKFGLSNSNAHGWAVPQDWSTGHIGWDGYLPVKDYPKVINPVTQRLWTANSRVVGEAELERIGNGGYAVGARSQQIRDGLFAQNNFTEQDFLAIQNDDRAIFLTPWRDFILEQILDYEFVQQENLSELVLYLQNWQARAAVNSVGYHFVREFRMNIRQAIFQPIADDINNAKPQEAVPIALRPIRHQLEIPMWQLLQEQPEHLVPKGFNNWTVFLQETVRSTKNQLIEQYGSLAEATWGARNTTKIQHPLSKAIPALSWLLDMPAQAINGDTYMPRVQGQSFGSSQRLVVSPGHEESGILHMPSSQSGHPLSPYYGNSHQDWIDGNATPLLPGAPKYKLTFWPQ